MASCITEQWVSYAPQARLTVEQESHDDTTATLSWKLEYVAHGYAAQTNGLNRSWSVDIDGSRVDSGGTNINGVAGTYTVASGSTTVNKGTDARNVSFSVSFCFDVTWSGVYADWKSASDSIGIGKKTSYTVSYDANGGKGAPNSQTKWFGTNLTLSSTKPTRTGYVFKGWSLTKGGLENYEAGGTYNMNESRTLYAVWDENYLTINLYSNYATSAFSDALNAVGSDKNVLVKTQTFYYDNAYENGIANYSGSSGGAYMTRTGYTATGKWGTSTNGGTLVDEDTEFATGQALAQTFGKSLESGNASVNVYAQWTENILTVNYYSNYATESFNGALNPVGEDKNVIVRTSSFKYTQSISSGLHNYSTSDAGTYLGRIRYDALGYWGTAPDVEIGDLTGQIITTDKGVAVHEDKGFTSGQELAEIFGLSLETGNASINLYAQFVLLCSRITVYTPDGNGHRGLCHFYDDDGNVHYAIITIYDQNGTARVVV